MEPSEPHIEIFAPFGEAFETTKKILFQPFDSEERNKPDQRRAAA